MHHKESIAAVVLTLNEELNLPRALESLKWCDETIVLDSGSIDNTHEIAITSGARLYTHIQTPPFRITDQRNWALAHCQIKSKWVLFLDADEMISPNLASHILQSIQNTTSDAFLLAPRYWFFGKWLKRVQSYPSWHPRLLRLGTVRFVGGVWESFSPGASISRIALPYEHFAFSKGIDDWIMRHLRYSDWEAKSIIKYLDTGKLSSFGTNRKLILRALSSRFYLARPFSRFIYKYFFLRGFLDGWQGLLYCTLVFTYDLITVVKVLQLTRLQHDKPL